jgi:hypothetical protein
MAALKNRQLQIPGGMKFYQPETKWSPPAFSSFDSIVRNLIDHRKANAVILKNYPVDTASVEMEVDTFNTRICLQMGWSDYVAGGGQPDPVPFHHPQPSSPNSLNAVAEKVKLIWAGIRTLDDWLDAGAPLAATDLSASRAATCAACTKNKPGDFTEWFTKPAAEAIKRQIEKAQNLNLTTPSDAQLNTCGVCWCPMKLKVHVPIDFVKKFLTDATLNGLKAVPNCWIPKEL